MRKAVFLDRDVVINKRAREHYIKRWEEFEFIPGAIEAVKELGKDFLVIVVSNQRGVSEGTTSEGDVETINEKMEEKFRKKNARIDGIYFCPHDIKENCGCWRPKPGMLLKAAKDFKINLSESYIIGDALTDIEGGKEVGCKTLLIKNPELDFSFKIKGNDLYPDYIASNLLEAVKIIQGVIIGQKMLTKVTLLFLKQVKSSNDLLNSLGPFFHKMGVKRESNLFQALSCLKSRFFRTIYDTLYDNCQLKKIRLINVHGNKMYINVGDKGITPRLLIDGTWERYKTELFRKVVKKGMVVADVGANIGFYTLIAARLVGGEGAVYAFEPEPNNYELLCKNIEANGFANAIAVRKAISNYSGKSKLWFTKEQTVNPSLSKDNVIFTSKQKVLTEGNFIEVEMVSLDEFFKDIVKDDKIDIIKLDTEGAEGLAVDGAENIILKNSRLKIFMEFWPEGLRSLGTDPFQLLQKLQGYGFKINLIDEKALLLRPIKIAEFCRGLGPGEGFDLLLEK